MNTHVVARYMMLVLLLSRIARLDYSPGDRNLIGRAGTSDVRLNAHPVIPTIR
jgi:hypothetical protein